MTSDTPFFSSYGKMLVQEPFALQKGGVLPEVTLRYDTYGKKQKNAVVIFAPLARGSHLAGVYPPEVQTLLGPFESRTPPMGWVDHAVGPGKAIDTDKFFVLGANALGGCLGTTGPTSLNPATSRPYGASFPEITMGDIARAHALLLDRLEIERAWVIGWSLGGLQALEFAIAYPERTLGLLALVSSHRPNHFVKQIEALASSIISRDPAFSCGDNQEQPPSLQDALLVFYMSAFSRRQLDYILQNRGFESIVQLASRFSSVLDAVSFLRTMRASAHYDGGPEERLRALASSPLCKKLVAVEDDQLYAPEEVERAAMELQASYSLVQSPFGHLAVTFDKALILRFCQEFMKEAS